MADRDGQGPAQAGAASAPDTTESSGLGPFRGKPVLLMLPSAGDAHAEVVA
jgi:hypothetical protein